MNIWSTNFSEISSICSCLSVRLLRLANGRSLELVLSGLVYKLIRPYQSKCIGFSRHDSGERRFLHVGALAAVEPDVRCVVPHCGHGDCSCIA